MYDAMAEKKQDKPQAEDKRSEEKKMSVDGENAAAVEDKCDTVEENKSEEDKGENKEGGKESDEEEEAAEGDDCCSPLKLWIFKP